jgi:hypothetical protein
LTVGSWEKKEEKGSWQLGKEEKDSWQLAK